jgi:hypothetical protein
MAQGALRREHHTMKALKPFNYSHDGVTPLHLAEGDDASDVPAELLPGLIAEGYVSEAKAAKPAKNKAISAAPENKSGEGAEGEAEA